MPEIAVAVKRKAGRPPGKVNELTRDVQMWARENAHIAKAALLELCASENERIRLDAVQALLNRAYGMPRQSVTMDGQVAQVFAGIKIVIGGKDAAD